MAERRFARPPLIADAQLGVRRWSLIFVGTLTVALVASPARSGVQTGCCRSFCGNGPIDCADNVASDNICQTTCEARCANDGGCDSFNFVNTCPPGQARVGTGCGSIDFCGPICGTFTPTRTETATPTTPTPTATRVPEGGACMETEQCETGLRCFEGTCIRLSVTPATSRGGFLVALAVLATVAGLTLRKTARGRKDHRSSRGG